MVLPAMVLVHQRLALIRGENVAKGGGLLVLHLFVARDSANIANETLLGIGVLVDELVLVFA